MLKESSMDNQIVRVTWEQVGQYLNNIVSKVDKDKISGVYGIPRGGLTLAAWLSHKLYVPLLTAPSDNCIIIDDICDSGESLLHYVNQSSTPEGEKDKGYFITTMFYTKNNKYRVKPDYYFDLKEDKWIVFPWEE